MFHLGVLVGLRKDNPTLSLPVRHDDNPLHFPLVARTAPDADTISLWLDIHRHGRGSTIPTRSTAQVETITHVTGWFSGTMCCSISSLCALKACGPIVAQNNTQNSPDWRYDTINTLKSTNKLPDVVYRWNAVFVFYSGIRVCLLSGHGVLHGASLLRKSPCQVRGV